MLYLNFNLGQCKTSSGLCFDSLSNTSYVWDSTPVDWNEAVYSCLQRNAQLAVIKDPDVIQAVSSKIRTGFDEKTNYKHVNHFWLGASVRMGMTGLISSQGNGKLWIL